MAWLVLWATLQGGLVFQQFGILGPTGAQMWQTPPGSTEATLSFGATAFKHVKLAGFVKTYQRFDSGVQPGGLPFEFTPFQATYGLSLTVHLGDFTIGAKHTCGHPVINLDGPVPPAGSYLRSSNTEVFVRVHIATTLR